MKTNVLLLLVNERKQQAPTIQKVFTEWGCLIKTRLGIHSGVLDSCTNTGLIFLELAGEKDKHEEMTKKLNLLPGVTAKLVELELKNN